MTSQICVDASLIVALLIPERCSPAALEQWKAWMLADRQIVAPQLIRYECTSTIYRKAFTGGISIEDSQEAIQRFLALDIQPIDPPELIATALRLAVKFHRLNLYDSHYLALSEYLSCPFWTGDERLFNAVQSGFQEIHWIGQASNHPTG